MNFSFKKLIVTGVTLGIIATCSSAVYAGILGNLSYDYLTTDSGYPGYLTGQSTTWFDQSVAAQRPGNKIPVSMIAGVKVFRDGVLTGDHDKQTVGGYEISDYIDRNTHSSSSDVVLIGKHNWWWGTNDASNEYRETRVQWPCSGSLCGPN